MKNESIWENVKSQAKNTNWDMKYFLNEADSFFTAADIHCQGCLFDLWKLSPSLRKGKFKEFSLHSPTNMLAKFGRSYENGNQTHDTSLKHEINFEYLVVWLMELIRKTLNQNVKHENDTSYGLTSGLSYLLLILLRNHTFGSFEHPNVLFCGIFLLFWLKLW